MRVDQFDFELPNERIALRPASPRDCARMLVVNRSCRGGLDDEVVIDLPKLLRAGDALMFNDTRVIPAQLEGVRIRQNGPAKSEAGISITLHMRLDENHWLGFAKGAKKLAPGDRLLFNEDAKSGACEPLTGQIVKKGEGGEVKIAFDVSGHALDLALVRVGHIPLPPYIAAQRADDEHDRHDYQTIYAEKDGAVAAPTAGLHFTDGLLQQLRAGGVATHFVTLHVGAGTFLPVKTDDTDAHKMHAEQGYVSAETAEALNNTRRNGGRIVSVGTTSLRLLESAADDNGHIHPLVGRHRHIYYPRLPVLRRVDMLMTNFHLPRSTLFMLVAAFSGLETMHKAYQHAIKDKIPILFLW